MKRNHSCSSLNFIVMMASCLDDLRYPLGLLLNAREACKDNHSGVALPKLLLLDLLMQPDAPELVHSQDASLQKASANSIEADALTGVRLLPEDRCAHASFESSRSNRMRYTLQVLLAVREACQDSNCEIPLPKLAPLDFLSEPQEDLPPEASAMVADVSSHSCAFEDEPSADSRPTVLSSLVQYPLGLLLSVREACANSHCDETLPKMLPLDFIGEEPDASPAEEIASQADMSLHSSQSPGLESQCASAVKSVGHDMKLLQQTKAFTNRTSNIHCAFEMCPWIGSDIEYSVHITRCPCRPVSCPNRGCNWVGQYSSLLGHQSQCAPRMTVAIRHEYDAYDNDVGNGSRKKREMWRNARLREHGSAKISGAGSKVGSSQQGRRERRNFRQAPMAVASQRDAKMVRVDCGPAYRLVPIAAPAAAPVRRAADAPTAASDGSTAQRADLQPTIPDELALEWALAASVDDVSIAASKNAESCAICLEELNLESSSVVHLPLCNHAFHLLCVPTMQLPQSAAAGAGDALCAICRTPFTLAEVRPAKADAPCVQLETAASHASAPAARSASEQSASACKLPATAAGRCVALSAGTYQDEAGDEETRSQSNHSLDVDERLLQAMETRLDAELGADVHNLETFGETKQWSFQENLAANLRNQEAQASRASASRDKGSSSAEMWLDWGTETSQTADAQAGSRWRSARHREKLIRAIFRACNLSKNGRLTAAEMCKFACFTGFDGSDADWKTEYTMLCEDRGCKPHEGLECKDFVELVNDDSDIGCYCTTTELQSIHAKLTDATLPSL